MRADATAVVAAASRDVGLHISKESLCIGSHRRLHLGKTILLFNSFDKDTMSSTRFVFCLLRDSFFRIFYRLSQIKWSNRLKGNPRVKSTVSVDGTDFRLQRQHPCKCFYSHKFKASGYRYEVAICIKTGDIIWTHGPFP